MVTPVARSALPRRNVLALDGWRYEDGGPGIHGACCRPANCPHRPTARTDRRSRPGSSNADGYLAGLSGDVLLVNVHCHV